MKKNASELIDEILKSNTFNRPADLAEAYLNHKETFPFILFSEFLKKVSSIKITKEAIKKDFKKCWNNILKETKQKISKDAMGEIEKNYKKETINKILAALMDFEPFLKGSPVSVVNYEKKSLLPSFKRKHKNIINKIEFLVKEANLSDSERETLQRIKTRHQDIFKQSQVKKVAIDPVKEALLNVKAKAAYGTLLTGLNPGGFMEFYLQCNSPKTVFIKPEGRPKEKIFLNALVIVICNLLENNNTQVKWRYGLTADIINQYFGLTGKEALTLKRIDNALHST